MKPTTKILYGLPEGNQLYCTAVHACLVAGFRAAEVTAWKCVPMKKKAKVKPVKYRSIKANEVLQAGDELKSTTRDTKEAAYIRICRNSPVCGCRPMHFSTFRFRRPVK